MIITVTDADVLFAALARINASIFEDNLAFMVAEPVNAKRTRFRVRLQAYDRNKPGGIRGKSACWHAHGHYFEALFLLDPEAKVSSRGKTITSKGGNWEDYEIGRGEYASGADCSCGVDCKNWGR